MTTESMYIQLAMCHYVHVVLYINQSHEHIIYCLCPMLYSIVPCFGYCMEMSIDLLCKSLRVSFHIWSFCKLVLTVLNWKSIHITINTGDWKSTHYNQRLYILVTFLLHCWKWGGVNTNLVTQACVIIKTSIFKWYIFFSSLSIIIVITSIHHLAVSINW